jgi:glutamate-1-semialdehyde 2,1-aminomutase
MTDYPQLPDGAALRRRAAGVLPASAVRHDGFDELVVRGQGAYLWTADGRRLVDYFLSHGTTVVGHSDPAVNDAAALAAACCGRTGIGLQRAEVELAEQIVAWLPSAEKVAFVTGGDEALRRAIEVSRAATGRQRILTSSIGDPRRAHRLRPARARGRGSRPCAAPPRRRERCAGERSPRADT